MLHGEVGETTCEVSLLCKMFGLFPHVISDVNEQMQAGDPGVGAPMTVPGAQSRSEDEESLGVKDVKRTATQAFGSGVPKRRSSSRFHIFYCTILIVTIVCQSILLAGESAYD